MQETFCLTIEVTIKNEFVQRTNYCSLTVVIILKNTYLVFVPGYLIYL